MRSTSSSPSTLASTTAATPLPIMFMSARATLMIRSIPRINAMPASGMAGTIASVATSAMKAAPVTPLAPLEVRMATAKMADLLHQSEFRVRGLRDEQRRHRHIDAGADGVEDVARGDHKADH